jgi:hypothetical protein
MHWLLPWGAARQLYGPYTAFRQGEFGTQLDPVLRILVPVRLWFGLGVVVVLAKLLTDPSLNQTVQDVFSHGVITMVLGPFGVALGAVAVVAVAGRGRRGAAARSVVRPSLIAAGTVLLSVSVFGLQLPGVRQAVQGLLDRSQSAAPTVLASMVGLVLGPWLLVFGVCAVYLMHRNGFSAGIRNPLLRPIVASWLALTVAAVQLTVDERAGLSRGAFVASVLAGPVMAIGLSVVEFRRTRSASPTVRRESAAV